MYICPVIKSKSKDIVHLSGNQIQVKRYCTAVIVTIHCSMNHDNMI